MTTEATTCEKVELSSLGNGSYGSVQPVLEKYETALLLVLGFGGVSILLAVAHRLVRKYVYHDVDNVDTTFDAGGRVSTSLTAVTVASQFLWPGDFLQSSTITVKSGVSGPFWYTVGAALNIALFPIVSVYLKTRAPGAKTYLQNATPDCDPAICAGSHQMSQTNISKLLDFFESIINEVESSIKTVKNGFQDEKLAVRKMLAGQANTIQHVADLVHTVETEANNAMKIRNEAVERTDKSIRETFNDHRNEVAVKLETISDDVTVVNGTLNKKQEDIVSELNDVSAELSKVKSDMHTVENKVETFTKQASIVNEAVKKNQEDFGNELNDISSELNNVKSDMNQVSSVISDVSRTVNTILKIMGYTDWTTYKMSAYRFHSERVTWSQARQKCQEDGLHLVEINDKEELLFVRQMHGDRWCWYGSTDVMTEGVWKWSTSGLSVPASLWCPQAPDNLWGLEHCMLHDGDYCLNDGHCNFNSTFVCEIEL